MEKSQEQIVELIENILQAKDIPHVKDSERRAAITRAVKTIGIDQNMTVEKIIDCISTNEGQIDVHSDPSDVKDC